MKFESCIKCTDSMVPLILAGNVHMYTHANSVSLHCKFNLHFTQLNILLLSCCCIKKK